MLLASMFENPLLSWLPRVLRAQKIPDLGQHSTEILKEIGLSEAAIEAMLASGATQLPG